MDPIPFEQIGRLPAADDNVAIAIRTVDAGTAVQYGGQVFRLSHTVLEGHRFVVQSIPQGGLLTSWGQAFGTALVAIEAGDYVANEAVLTELGRRTLDFALPKTPNFSDEIPEFVFDAARFTPAASLPLYPDVRHFMGYRRAGTRGVGTRNMIVLLGTSSLTAGFVRALETQLKPLAAQYPNIDGIVAVAHTEGGHRDPNNRDMLLRTLAGFMVHPNVGAVLAVDYGSEPVNNAALVAYAEENDFPLDEVPHQFLSVAGSFQENLDAAQTVVENWLEIVNGAKRTAEPLHHLKIALQCGGSDAFSGVSGNPLAAWVAREVIQNGGSANLAETDELIGAETYILDKVKDLPTAQKFLDTLARFVERASYHGHSAAGNPSGGNVYRGLYNIYLKSLGAAAKRHPDVRLDAVIEYAEPMTAPGFYFMDSPGNDLESVAGQVAAGCNMIFFVTGNGSITNFPFVPTIKIVTTTRRYELLSNEMDVNAGAYLDGTPLDQLGQAMFERTLEAASGAKSVGEQAKHAQVQIWRDWRQTAPAKPAAAISKRSGQPISIPTVDTALDVSFSMIATEEGPVAEQVGLILPTSLCSGQIARMCVERLNECGIGRDQGLSRFVTLVHTEGCGASTETEYITTLLGYLQHPLVRHCLLLEHGCEKTHNGYMRQLMDEAGIDPQPFGWASVQMDGGIEAVIEKMMAWFEAQVARDKPLDRVPAGLGTVRMGLLSRGTVNTDAARVLNVLTRQIVSSGGTVVLPENDSLTSHQAYLELEQVTPSLAYAQRPDAQGFHVMQMVSTNWAETLTGLGASGVQVILAITDALPLAGHPLVPVLQVGCKPGHSDLDLVLREEPDRWMAQILEQLGAVLSREYIPRQNAQAHVDFQITRGLLGVSL